MSSVSCDAGEQRPEIDLRSALRSALSELGARRKRGSHIRKIVRGVLDGRYDPSLSAGLFDHAAPDS